MKMKWTLWIGSCALALVGQVSEAQTSVGNVLSGDAKVEVLHSYSGSDTLLKPERVVIQDFTTVGDVVMDDSMATRLHQHSLLRRGSDEDATSEALIRKVQDSFAKTLIAQFKKVSVASDRVASCDLRSPNRRGTERSSRSCEYAMDGRILVRSRGNVPLRIRSAFQRTARTNTA
jgi:hypothetical protein